MKRLKINWNFWIVRFLFVMVVILGYKVISNFGVVTSTIENFFRVLSPFILGFVVAYLLTGPQRQLQKLLNKINLEFVKKRSYGLSIFLLYAISFFFIFLALNYIVPLIIANLIDLINLLPTFYNYLIEVTTKLENQGIGELLKLDEIVASLTSSYSPEKLILQATSSLASIGIFAKNISTTVLNTFLVFIISVYVLIFKESISDFFTQVFRKIMSEKNFENTKRFFRRSSDVFYKFIGGQVLDAVILGILATILLSLLGVKFALTLGILLGLCNMIPYFGAIFASVLTTIITFFTGGLNLALITIVSLLILQQIDGNIIGPRIMKGALNLNPIIIIVSITVGGAYFGVLGMFLSVPVAGMLKIIVMEWLETKELSQ